MSLQCVCLIKLICICRLYTNSGGSRGGGLKNNVVLKMCFVNIYMQYSHTKYGNTEYFRSHLGIVLFPFFFHLGRRGTPSLFHPRSLLRVSNNEYLFFLLFFSYKCVLSIFIYNIALQNADFGVLQKSSKHFLISIFFPPGERGTTPPCPTRSVQFCS